MTKKTFQQKLKRLQQQQHEKLLRRPNRKL
jgi:hypothetical protein